MKYFLLIAHGDVDPEIQGPFEFPGEREAHAKQFRDSEGLGNGIFALDIDANGMPETWAYPGDFLDKEDEEKERAKVVWMCRECGRKFHSPPQKGCLHCGGELIPV